MDEWMDEWVDERMDGQKRGHNSPETHPDKGVLPVGAGFSPDDGSGGVILLGGAGFSVDVDAAAASHKFTVRLHVALAKGDMT